MADRPTHDPGASDAGDHGHVADDLHDPRPIELVVGLGNPGERYAATRHNVGYRVVDELARRHSDALWVHRRLCDLSSIGLGARLLLAKPLTFMNRSGEAVVWLLDHLELEPDQMLVAVDDVALPLGTLRLRRWGGPGTHNGLRDICDRVGRNFPRIRLGVGPEAAPHDLAEYVTTPFARAERPIVERMEARAADAIEASVLEGIPLAMSRYNGPVDED